MSGFLETEKLSVGYDGKPLIAIIVMLIMRIGSMMSVGSEKVLLMYNEMTYDTADVISTFVYRRGLQKFEYSFSTAVDVFNSVINIILLVSANWLSARFAESSLW